jgi:hypothetical protein
MPDRPRGSTNLLDDFLSAPAAITRNLLGDQPSMGQQIDQMGQAQQAALASGGIRGMLHDPTAYERAKQVAGNLNFTGTMGKPGIPAYHATDQAFDEFDFRKLGRNTLRNQTSLDRDTWAMRLARVGAWFHEGDDIAKKMATEQAKKVNLLGDVKDFGSLDELDAFIQDAGGPLKARKALSDEGYGLLRVKDEEFGGTSFVALSPKAIEKVRQ